MKVQIDYADGHYTASVNTGPRPSPEMTEAQWAAYLCYQVQCQFWYKFLRELDNYQYFLDNPDGPQAG